MTNPQEIFQREKKLGKLFQKKEEKQNIFIRYNVLSEGLVIWVGYNKEDDWGIVRGELMLSCLIKNFKLDKIRYKERPAILRYKSPYWESHELTVECNIPCPKFDFEVYDLSYQDYDTEYNF